MNLYLILVVNCKQRNYGAQISNETVAISGGNANYKELTQDKTSSFLTTQVCVFGIE